MRKYGFPLKLIKNTASIVNNTTVLYFVGWHDKRHFILALVTAILVDAWSTDLMQ